MPGKIALVIAPLIVWVGLFLYLLWIDRQVRELRK
jgi:CcmD family protein